MIAVGIARPAIAETARMMDTFLFITIPPKLLFYFISLRTSFFAS